MWRFPVQHCVTRVYMFDNVYPILIWYIYKYDKVLSPLLWLSVVSYITNLIPLKLRCCNYNGCNFDSVFADSHHAPASVFIHNVQWHCQAFLSVSAMLLHNNITVSLHIQCEAVVKWSIFLTHIRKGHPQLAFRVRYGICVVDQASDWYTASVAVIIYIISYNIGPPQNTIGHTFLEWFLWFYISGYLICLS